MLRPEQKHQRALNASHTNGQGLANQTGQHDRTAPGQLSWAPRWAAGGRTLEQDTPYRLPHPADWSPGQSLQLQKTHAPPREPPRKQGLEASRKGPPGGALAKHEWPVPAAEHQQNMGTGHRSEHAYESIVRTAHLGNRDGVQQHAKMHPGRIARRPHEEAFRKGKTKHERRVPAAEKNQKGIEAYMLVKAL